MRGEERQEKLGKSGKKRRGKREAGDMEKRRGSIQRKRRDLKRKRKKQNNSRRAIRSGEFEQQVLHDVEQQAHTRTRKQSKRGREKEQRCDRTHAASEWRRDSPMLCCDARAGKGSQSSVSGGKNQKNCLFNDVRREKETTYIRRCSRLSLLNRGAALASLSFLE